MTSNNTLHNLLASAAGGSVAEVATLPICTIKTNYQANLHYSGIREVVWKVYRTKGIIGFYNSSFAAISSQTVSTTTKYTFYNVIKSYRDTEPSDLMNNVINGMAAGVLSTMFTHPLDAIKIHQQQDNLWHQLIRTEGPTVLYRGLSKSLSKNVMLTGLLFPLYDFYNHHVTNVTLAALYTSLSVSTLIHPLDFLKVRHISNEPLFLGWNPLLYYRGFTLNLMRSVPHFMITMYVTEMIKRWLG